MDNTILTEDKRRKDWFLDTFNVFNAYIIL